MSNAFAQNSLSTRVATLLGSQNYKLEGSGFTASSPVAMSKGISAGAIWKKSDAVDYYFKTLHMQSEVSAPKTLSPADVTSNLRIFDLGVIKNLENASRFTLSAQWRERNATASNPNRYLPHYQSMGIRLGLECDKTFSGLWKLESGAGIYLPLYFDERSDKTGQLKFSLMPELNLDLVYVVNPSIDFSIGAKVLLEKLYYTGSGARGVSEAKEEYINFILPIELRFLF